MPSSAQRCVSFTGLLAAPLLVTAVLLTAALVLLGAPAARAGSASWGWPLAGPHEVSRPFAPPAFRYGVGHRGVDLPGAPGAVVRAAGAGRISYAGLVAGRSVVVVVHGDLRTTYEPVEPAVALGDEVAVGEPIGRLMAGHAGCGAAACLHWGLRRGDDYLDPVRLVERPPLRLLPVGPPVTRAGPAAPAVVAGAARTRPVAPAPPERSLTAPGHRPVGEPAASPVAAHVGDLSPSAGSRGPGRAGAVAAAATAVTASALVAAAAGAAVRHRRAAS